jgi:hypothetical protein
MSEGLQAVVARLEKVERQNRRMRLAGLAILLFAGTGLLMGQAAPSHKTIDARELILRDDGGTPRIKLFVTDHGPMLSMIRANGKPQVGLGLGENGIANLSLFDKKGQARVALGAFGPGDPGIVILDYEGKTVWSAPQRLD